MTWSRTQTVYMDFISEQTFPRVRPRTLQDSHSEPALSRALVNDTVTQSPSARNDGLHHLRQLIEPALTRDELVQGTIGEQPKRQFHAAPRCPPSALAGCHCTHLG